MHAPIANTEPKENSEIITNRTIAGREITAQINAVPKE
jgi:hypothetical protein